MEIIEGVNLFFGIKKGRQSSIVELEETKSIQTEPKRQTKTEDLCNANFVGTRKGKYFTT